MNQAQPLNLEFTTGRHSSLRSYTKVEMILPDAMQCGRVVWYSAYEACLAKDTPR